eukprot:CAMPEP_0184486260 /NCGR_PEP_ID=MMETSP0113_2-20130426/7781_1 /TAXON_ID=91329 /ORGANISM="Norrisiella sphaerica, Strain BC52" /LENGTH=523 /DNA_ID=CAMNT_0026868047 /DNA_START=164 /DNA_END=1732 /DNA_ORIENTATION=+
MDTLIKTIGFEVGVLSRLLHRNHNQHRGAVYFRRLLKVEKLLKRLLHLARKNNSKTKQKNENVGVADNQKNNEANDNNNNNNYNNNNAVKSGDDVLAKNLTEDSETRADAINRAGIAVKAAVLEIRGASKLIVSLLANTFFMSFALTVFSLLADIHGYLVPLWASLSKNYLDLPEQETRERGAVEPDWIWRSLNAVPLLDAEIAAPLPQRPPPAHNPMTETTSESARGLVAIPDSESDRSNEDANPVTAGEIGAKRKDEEEEAGTLSDESDGFIPLLAENKDHLDSERQDGEKKVQAGKANLVLNERDETSASAEFVVGFESDEEDDATKGVTAALATREGGQGIAGGDEGFREASGAALETKKTRERSPRVQPSEAPIPKAAPKPNTAATASGRDGGEGGADEFRRSEKKDKRRKEKKGKKRERKKHSSPAKQLKEERSVALGSGTAKAKKKGTDASKGDDRVQLNLANQESHPLRPRSKKKRKTGKVSLSKAEPPAKVKKLRKKKKKKKSTSAAEMDDIFN